ncbi:unnamed protein product, partial [Ectocarpus sp. 12 AP-2014]
ANVQKVPRSCWNTINTPVGRQGDAMQAKPKQGICCPFFQPLRDADEVIVPKQPVSSENKHGSPVHPSSLHSLGSCPGMGYHQPRENSDFHCISMSEHTNPSTTLRTFFKYRSTTLSYKDPEDLAAPAPAPAPSPAPSKRLSF